MCYVILCVSVTFDIYVSVMIFVCDNLCCYGNMCYCDTVMICVSVMHYACDNYPINPTLDSWPKMAEYGEHFIPEWWAEFFWNWTNLIPIGQLLVVLSAIQAINMCFMSPLARSTDPLPCITLSTIWWKVFAFWFETIVFKFDTQFESIETVNQWIKYVLVPETFIWNIIVYTSTKHCSLWYVAANRSCRLKMMK